MFHISNNLPRQFGKKAIPKFLNLGKYKYSHLKKKKIKYLALHTARRWVGGQADKSHDLQSFFSYRTNNLTSPKSSSKMHAAHSWQEPHPIF